MGEGLTTVPGFLPSPRFEGLGEEKGCLLQSAGMVEDARRGVLAREVGAVQ
jgi:hypothetical protein